ncbi:MAG: Sec-independent protein translocase subunit TatA [Candidatus Paracaedibacter sp.]
MGMSFSHMALLLAIVLIVFGAGKLPRVMGDIAKGLKAFKDGMKDGEDADKVEKIPDDKNRAA